MWLFKLIFSICFINVLTFQAKETCTILNLFTGEGLYLPRFILYDVNQPEGFNLRRDVYMRLAIFIHNSLKKQKDNWYLVLPPWTRIYHWRQTDPDALIPWSTFFDIKSLQKFAPVIEMEHFLKGNKARKVDTIYILQTSPSALENDWEEKWEITKCYQKKFKLLNNNKFSGPLFEYYGITADNVKCVSFFGQAQQLEEIALFTKGRSLMFDHAEVALHDEFGSETYWKCRRSMRFALPLVQIATEFRSRYLNSNDINDRTVRPKDWQLEKAGRFAIGGPYLCVHMRRQDFVLARSETTPSLKYAAEQIKQKLKKLQLHQVFIATDAPYKEFKELQSLLKQYKVTRYVPRTKNEQLLSMDGAIAVIDQIICSHARYFLGSDTSTFSFRIEEEREIIGFKINTTFNRLCGDKETKCSQPTKWKIVY